MHATARDFPRIHAIPYFESKSLMRLCGIQKPEKRCGVMFSRQQPDSDPRRYYASPSEPLWEFSREATYARARAAAEVPDKPNTAEGGSSEATEMTTSRARRSVDTSKAYTEMVVDALRDQIESGELAHPPARAPRARLKHIKRVVDRRGVVRIYYVRGPKPHIRLPAPEGTAAFLEAYEAARSEKTRLWKSRRISSEPSRSMNDLVNLYRRTEDYARLSPDTRRAYDRVLRRLLHVEELSSRSAASLGQRSIQQLIDRHAGAPAAAADLLKKLRILFRCAIAHDWRVDDPTRDVRIGRGTVVATRL